MMDKGENRMKIEELKKILHEHSKEMGPFPGYFTENSVFELLYKFDLSGNKTKVYEDVDYDWIEVDEAEEIIIFDLKGEGKYFACLYYNNGEKAQEIEKIRILDGPNYRKIKNKLENKINEIRQFLDNMYVEELEKQYHLVNTFQTEKYT